MNRAYLGLGSNLGDRSAAIEKAVSRLTGLPTTRVIAVSSNHETDPVGGPPGQGRYLNAAVGIDTRLKVSGLLASTHWIEREMGREPSWLRVKDGPRVIDIDLLLYGDVVMRGRGPQVPHPRMAERRFVLEPLAEIASDVTHPEFQQTVSELLAALRAGVAT